MSKATTAGPRHFLLACRQKVLNADARQGQLAACRCCCTVNFATTPLRLGAPAPLHPHLVNGPCALAEHMAVVRPMDIVEGAQPASLRLTTTPNRCFPGGASKRGKEKGTEARGRGAGKVGRGIVGEVAQARPLARCDAELRTSADGFEFPLPVGCGTAKGRSPPWQSMGRGFSSGSR